MVRVDIHFLFQKVHDKKIPFGFNRMQDQLHVQIHVFMDNSVAHAYGVVPLLSLLDTDCAHLRKTGKAS